MQIPPHLGSIPSSLLPMQILLIMGNQFGQAVASRWRGAHSPSVLPCSLLNGKTGGCGIRAPSLPCQHCAVVRFMAHSQPCTGFVPHLPDHSSFHTAPALVHPTPLFFSPGFSWLSSLPPAPPSSHPAACSFPVLLVLNSPAAIVVPHSALFSSLHLHVFCPLAFNQALSSMNSAGEAPKK